MGSLPFVTIDDPEISETYSAQWNGLLCQLLWTHSRDFCYLSSVGHLILKPTWSCPRPSPSILKHCLRLAQRGLWAFCPAPTLPYESFWMLEAWTCNYRHQDCQLPQQRRPFQKAEKLDQVRWTSWSGHQRLWWLPWCHGFFLDVVTNLT